MLYALCILNYPPLLSGYSFFILINKKVIADYTD